MNNQVWYLIEYQLWLKKNTKLINVILNDQESLERMIKKVDPKCPYFSTVVKQKINKTLSKFV